MDTVGLYSTEMKYEDELALLYDRMLGPEGQMLALHTTPLSQLLAAVAALVQASQDLQSALADGARFEAGDVPVVVPDAQVVATVFGSSAGRRYLRLHEVYASYLSPAKYAMCELPAVAFEVNRDELFPEGHPGHVVPVLSTAVRLIDSPLGHLHRLQLWYQQAGKALPRGSRLVPMVTHTAATLGTTLSKVCRVAASSEMQELALRVPLLQRALPPSALRFVVAEDDFVFQPNSGTLAATVQRLTLFNDALLVSPSPPSSCRAPGAMCMLLRDCSIAVHMPMRRINVEPVGRASFPSFSATALPHTNLKLWDKFRTQASFGTQTVVASKTHSSRFLRSLCSTTTHEYTGVLISGEAYEQTKQYLAAPTGVTPSDKSLPTKVYDVATFASQDSLETMWFNVLQACTKPSVVLSTDIKKKATSGFRRKYQPAYAVLAITPTKDLSVVCTMLVYKDSAACEAKAEPVFKLDLNNIRSVGYQQTEPKRFAVKSGKVEAKFEAMNKEECELWTLALACVTEMMARMTVLSHTVARELAQNPDLALDSATATPASYRYSSVRKASGLVSVNILSLQGISGRSLVSIASSGTVDTAHAGAGEDIAPVDEDGEDGRGSSPKGEQSEDEAEEAAPPLGPEVEAEAVEDVSVEGGGREVDAVEEEAEGEEAEAPLEAVPPPAESPPEEKVSLPAEVPVPPAPPSPELPAVLLRARQAFEAAAAAAESDGAENAGATLEPSPPPAAALHTPRASMTAAPSTPLSLPRSLPRSSATWSPVQAPASTASPAASHPSRRESLQSAVPELDIGLPAEAALTGAVAVDARTAEWQSHVHHLHRRLSGFLRSRKRRSLPALPLAARGDDTPPTFEDVQTALEAVPWQLHCSLDDLQRSMAAAVPELNAVSMEARGLSEDDLRARVATAASECLATHKRVAALNTAWESHQARVWERAEAALRDATATRGQEEAAVYSAFIRCMASTNRQLAAMVDSRGAIAATLRASRAAIQAKFGEVADVVSRMVAAHNAGMELLVRKSSRFEDSTRLAAAATAGSASASQAADSGALADAYEDALVAERDRTEAAVLQQRVDAANRVRLFEEATWKELEATGDSRLEALRDKSRWALHAAVALSAKLDVLEAKLAEMAAVQAKAGTLTDLKRRVHHLWMMHGVGKRLRAKAMLQSLRHASHTTKLHARLRVLHTRLLNKAVRRTTSRGTLSLLEAAMEPRPMMASGASQIRELLALSPVSTGGM